MLVFNASGGAVQTRSLDRCDLRALVIDFDRVEPAARPAFHDAREQRRWLSRAAKLGASLAVLASPGRLELYTSERDHRGAFRAVIEFLNEKVTLEPALGRARTIELRGQIAARHLLYRAAGLEPGRLGDLGILDEIRRAVARSASCMALGHTLSGLLRIAADVGERVKQETGIADADAPEIFRELESFAAARIADNGFAAWLADTDPSVPLAAERFSNAPPSFPPAEPGSFLRPRPDASILRARES
jgi:hypothetical protein